MIYGKEYLYINVVFDLHCAEIDDRHVFFNFNYVIWESKYLIFLKYKAILEL